MPKPFYAEKVVEVGGEKLILSLDFHAIDATETLLDMGYDQVLEQLNDARGRFGVKGKVLWGMLRKHHPQITLDETATLMMGVTGVAVGMAVQELLEIAFGTAEDGAEPNPPNAPSGALETS